MEMCLCLVAHDWKLPSWKSFHEDLEPSKTFGFVEIFMKGKGHIYVALLQQQEEGNGRTTKLL